MGHHGLFLTTDYNVWFLEYTYIHPSIHPSIHTYAQFEILRFEILRIDRTDYNVWFLEHIIIIIIIIIIIVVVVVAVVQYYNNIHASSGS